MNERAREPIRHYLDAVCHYLAHLPDARRTEMLGEIESYIYEALNERTGGREATLEDVSAILSAMDAPESYARADGSTGYQRPAVRRVPGVLWITLGALALISMIQFVIGVEKGRVDVLVGVALNLILLLGLYYRSKIAYVATIVFVVLGTMVSFGRTGPAVGMGVLILDSVVLVPVLMSTDYFFPKRQTESWER